jgi:hypothetical protein
MVEVMMDVATVTPLRVIASFTTFKILKHAEFYDLIINQFTRLWMLMLEFTPMPHAVTNGHLPSVIHLLIMPNGHLPSVIHLLIMPLSAYMLVTIRLFFNTIPERL